MKNAIFATSVSHFSICWHLRLEAEEGKILTHLATDFTGENFGLVPGTGAAESGRGRRRPLEELVCEDLVPLLHVVLNLALRQLLERLHPGHRVPLAGLREARLPFVRYEGFVPRGEQVRGHRVQVDEASGRGARAAVPAAVQVAHGAHGGERLVHHPGSEKFVVARGLARGGGVLLLVLIVQAKAQKVRGSSERSRVNVARFQPGDTKPVARLVPERHQWDHAMQRGRTGVWFPHGCGLEPARERYRLGGLGRPGHNPVDGESQRFAAAAGGEHVRARGLAPRSRGGAEDPRWAAKRTVHHLHIKCTTTTTTRSCWGEAGGRCKSSPARWKGHHLPGIPLPCSRSPAPFLSLHGRQSRGGCGSLDSGVRRAETSPIVTVRAGKLKVDNLLNSPPAFVCTCRCWKWRRRGGGGCPLLGRTPAQLEGIW